MIFAKSSNKRGKSPWKQQFEIYMHINFFFSRQAVLFLLFTVDTPN